MKKLFLALSRPLYHALQTAHADVLVLVHGYLGTAQSWAEAGVIDRLQQRGYRMAGTYGFSAQGVLFQELARQRPQKPIYTVNLPSQAPVVIQADWLAALSARTAQASSQGDRSTSPPIPPAAWLRA